MRYVIGIDIGTTSTKAVAYTEKGAVLERAETSYSAFTDGNGMHELDPGVLFDAVITVLLQVTGHRTHGDEAVAVSFSCAMHSLILVDEAGNLLTRALTWADTRSERSAAVLKQSESGRRIYRETGVPIHAMSPLCKLLWLKDTQHDLFRRAARFVSIKEYVWWRLFGKYQVDLSIASATGLLDIRGLDWYDGSLELADIQKGQLSELVACTHCESALMAPWRSLGFAEGTPFVIGAGDGGLANLGTGAVRKGETALTIGTSAAIRMAVTSPEYDRRERLFCYLLSDHIYISGGATNNGGNAVQWYADLILGKGRWDVTMLDRLVASAQDVSPGSDGLIFLPYLLGERAPVWDAEAKGLFYGVRSIHDQRAFMRSVLEGVAFSLKQIGESLQETIGPIARLHASGGFTRSAFWLQMIADIFGKTVVVSSGADASAVGAAMLGWVALGVFADPGEAVALIGPEMTYAPDPARHVAYEENYRVFIQLYDRMNGVL